LQARQEEEQQADPGEKAVDVPAAAPPAEEDAGINIEVVAEPEPKAKKGRTSKRGSKPEPVFEPESAPAEEPAAVEDVKQDDQDGAGAGPAGNGFGLISPLVTQPKPTETAVPMEVEEPEPTIPPQQEETEKEKSHKKKQSAKPRGGALTMADISKDELTQLAETTWSSTALQAAIPPAFKPALVEQIYKNELGGGTQEPAPRRVGLLELSQYLENYLWRGYEADKASVPHLLSIVLMVNEKYKEGFPAWDCFTARPEDFTSFFNSLLTLPSRHTLSHFERLAYLNFVSNSFQSLENELVRGRVLRLVGLPMWHALSRGRLQLELHEHPQLAKHWKHMAKKDAKKAQVAGVGYIPTSESIEATFLPSLLTDFLEHLSSAVNTSSNTVDTAAVRYCERFIAFLSSLLSQLPTRRFVHAVVEDKAILVKCHLSALQKRQPEGVLFSRLVEGLRSVLSFPIDDHTGDSLTEDAVTAAHYERVQQLQRLLFKHWPKLNDLALSNCGKLENRDVLTKFLSQLTPDELRLLVTAQLRLVDENDPSASNPAFLTEVMVSAYERRRPQREIIEAMPLYPTEELLLDGDAVPGDQNLTTLGDGVLALPRLNLQFLTLNDYLVRNFYLFRLEAAYEVREDVAEALKRTAPYLGDDDAVHFGGWSRMAQPLEKFALVEVRKPRVGETYPAAVTAEITVDVKHMRPDVRAEWDSLKQHDVVFMLSVAPSYPQGGMSSNNIDWKGQPTDVALKQAGLKHVRGCEILEIRDQEGKLMNDYTGRVAPEEQGGAPRGTLRTLTVALDPMQYQSDLSTATNDIYSSFTLVMRRNAKENNFKAVLEGIRDLVADEEATSAIPSWLHDVILGYGDPADALYSAMDQKCLHTVDFKDTFLDVDHLKESFGGKYHVEVKPVVGESEARPPFRLTFPSFAIEEENNFAADGAGGEKEAEDDASGKNKKKGKRKAGQEEPEPSPSAPKLPTIIAESYALPDPGPYPQDAPPLNTVRFTPVQTEAILSGVQPGLTMVVGPPGTGKTDTAVQIMHILYHNCPNQRTLIITHSNQALNDLFQKIIERDVPARYLLRLGMGEADLDTEEQFSRVGRVNAMLMRRLELLSEVERLAKSLKVPEGVAYTCETAAHFWLLHVFSRWEKFTSAVKTQKSTNSNGCVAELFPFKDFFSDAPNALFTGEDFSADWQRAEGCFRHLRTMFQELEEVRPFEILKTQGDRINYLLTKQAKIVAMTCTHAALKRKEFLEMGFTYDNLLMEEAAQVLEIETALPLLLQRAEDGQSRLKRVILIGDHHQLPPVVKNTALQKVSKMDQSLFSRFVRLGAPYVELNAQGRARPSIAALYNWRYRDLGDLPRVATQPAFLAANPGFAFEYQLIDVPDFLGRGEHESVPHFYQNLGEAEYLVSVYQYMRLLGYPASSISILTTYNGQRALLQDVVERRCASHPLFGRPRTVSTVDKYQGQQNDYVLLSLVRTRHFGHLRDVRRLVVAMSRARLGLYVFARGTLFANCFELQPAFRQLLGRPTQLALVAGEQFNSGGRGGGGGDAGGLVQRQVGDAPADALLVQGVEHMASIVQQMGSEWEAAAAGGGGGNSAAAPVNEEMVPAAAAGAGGKDEEDGA
jgi:intron-binding protein aquarius